MFTGTALSKLSKRNTRPSAVIFLLGGFRRLPLPLPFKFLRWRFTIRRHLLLHRLLLAFR
jgi:hypothetical protein